jgi:hypothetical protein
LFAPYAPAARVLGLSTEANPRTALAAPHGIIVEGRFPALGRAVRAVDSGTGRHGFHRDGFGPALPRRGSAIVAWRSNDRPAAADLLRPSAEEA